MPDVQDSGDGATVVPVVSRIRYLVTCREGDWFITFNGDEFGPYNSERVATLFAIDAAQELGRQGEDTQVIVIDPTGNAVPAWTFGEDHYPPRI